jgi:hypothetical protein
METATIEEWCGNNLADKAAEAGARDQHVRMSLHNSSHSARTPKRDHTLDVPDLSSLLDEAHFRRHSIHMAEEKVSVWRGLRQGTQPTFVNIDY